MGNLKLPGITSLLQKAQFLDQFTGASWEGAVHVCFLEVSHKLSLRHLESPQYRSLLEPCVEQNSA